MNSDNLYHNTAALYDLRAEMRDYPDVDFYLERAKGANGAILELACGTGRVTIPLAEAGNEVWGIDLSKEMLAVLDEKRTLLSPEANDRLHTELRDMSDFDLGRTFSLIIIPVRSLIVLPTREQQLGCLECVRKHLAPGGVFIPTAMWLPHMKTTPADPNRKERPTGEMTDPKTDRRIRRASIGHGADTEKGFFSSEMVFYIEQADGSEKRVSDQMDQAIVSAQEWRDLLSLAGFEILEEMSDYHGAPVPDNPTGPTDLIFVCESAMSGTQEP